MVWKKTSTNYSKWDYFTSSSESETEDTDPIVPKNDPNFQALEKDLEERASRRKQAKQKAETWKLKGNEFLQKNNYVQAAEMYTKGLEEIKDYKALYTNRALAYLHLGKFQQAVKDCDQVLEYCECFEDGYEKSRDACFKSYLRKAVALKEMKKFKEANESVKEARKLMPKNEEGRKLQEEIEFILKHEQVAKEIEETRKEQIQKPSQKEGEEEKKEEDKEETILLKQGLPYRDQVDFFLKLDSPTKDDMASLELCFKSTSESKVYFYENKGISKLLSLLKNKNCYSLMNVFFEKNIYYQTEFAKCNGITLLLERICQHLQKCNENKQLYDEIEDIFEVLVTFSLQEQLREWFKTDTKFVAPVLEKASAHLLINFNNEPNVLASYFSFLTNIVYGGQSSKVTEFIHNHKVLFYTTIRDILSIFRAKPKFLLLKQHILTFLSNLLTNKQMRDDVAQQKEIIGYLVYNLIKININNEENDFRWVEFASSLLGVFSNLTYQPEATLIQRLKTYKLARKVQFFIIDVLTKHSNQIDKVGLVIARGMQVIIRIQLEKEELNDIFCDWIFKCFSKEFIEQGIASFAIKVLVLLLSDNKYSINQASYLERFKILSPQLHQFILLKIEDEALFCNACSLLKLIIQSFPQLIMQQKPIIQALIDVCKDKLGKIRKNAAILLATLGKNSGEMLEFIRELHGMEVLSNVSSFVLDNKA